MVNRFASMSATLTLKVVGMICILSFFINFVILLLDFNPTNKLIQIGLGTAIVDRGITPMLGIGLLFVAYWIESNDAGSDIPKGIELRFPALILSSILGLMFLLIFPWHINNVIQVRSQALKEINERSGQQENQLKQELSQFQARVNSDAAKARIEQFRTQAKPQLKAEITELLKDEQKYNQALGSPQISPEQKELLKKVKADPKLLDQELDKFLAQATDSQARATQTANQQLNLIRTQREQDREQAQNAWKPGLRIAISSLLLSIGYIIIGWTGLKGMGALKGGGRKATAR
ncbi:HpsJ family protein [Fortiea contorta]|uniref:hormogonium polysaccharide biosynthesis protein HpsJ n=1 Tax=Fortiea contorta TaxID=1892405 RepID=UPI00034CE2A1|nr:HpsJ family protein [Fortiea contorta]